MRHKLDPSLIGTLQHQWKREKSNVKPEANWSVLRRDFTPGFEALFEQGVLEGLYDVNKPLEKCVPLFSKSPYLMFTVIATLLALFSGG